MVANPRWKWAVLILLSIAVGLGSTAAADLVFRVPATGGGATEDVPPVNLPPANLPPAYLAGPGLTWESTAPDAPVATTRDLVGRFADPEGGAVSLVGLALAGPGDLTRAGDAVRFQPGSVSQVAGGLAVTVADPEGNRATQTIPIAVLQNGLPPKPEYGRCYAVTCGGGAEARALLMRGANASLVLAEPGQDGPSDRTVVHVTDPSQTGLCVGETEASACRTGAASWDPPRNYFGDGTDPAPRACAPDLRPGVAACRTYNAGIAPTGFRRSASGTLRPLASCGGIVEVPCPPVPPAPAGAYYVGRDSRVGTCATPEQACNLSYLRTTALPPDGATIAFVEDTVSAQRITLRTGQTLTSHGGPWRYEMTAASVDAVTVPAGVTDVTIRDLRLRVSNPSASNVIEARTANRLLLSNLEAESGTTLGASVYVEAAGVVTVRNLKLDYTRVNPTVYRAGLFIDIAPGPASSVDVEGLVATRHAGMRVSLNNNQPARFALRLSRIESQKNEVLWIYDNVSGLDRTAPVDIEITGNDLIQRDGGAGNFLTLGLEDAADVNVLVEGNRMVQTNRSSGYSFTIDQFSAASTNNYFVVRNNVFLGWQSGLPNGGSAIEISTRRPGLFDIDGNQFGEATDTISYALEGDIYDLPGTGRADILFRNNRVFARGRSSVTANGSQDPPRWTLCLDVSGNTLGASSSADFLARRYYEVRYIVAVTGAYNPLNPDSFPGNNAGPGLFEIYDYLYAAGFYTFTSPGGCRAAPPPSL